MRPIPLQVAAGGPGIIPTVALFSSAQTPTNCTETAFTDSDQGVELQIASATVNSRHAGRMTAGTRIAAQLSGIIVSTGTTGLISGGSSVRIQRADGKVISMGMDQANTQIYRWTNKDTYVATLITLGRSTLGGERWWGRLGEDGLGNVVAELSRNGVTWDVVYTAAIATAWGDAGATTLVGFGGQSQNATAKLHVACHRCTVTP